MADYQADILTPWGVDGGSNTAQLWIDYRRTFNPDGSIASDGIYRCEDVTGTAGPHLPPSPNLCAVRVLLPETTLQAIESDGTYYVLTSQEVTVGG